MATTALEPAEGHAIPLPAPIVAVLDRYGLHLERDAFAWWLTPTDPAWPRFGPFVSALDAVETFRDALGARHGLGYEGQQVARTPEGGRP